VHIYQPILAIHINPHLTHLFRTVFILGSAAAEAFGSAGAAVSSGALTAMTIERDLALAELPE
jgi:hypothetical protein